MRDEKARGPEESPELRKPVQKFDPSNVLERLRKEKAYQEHGRSGLTLAHEPALRVVLTAVAAGRRTGEERTAGPSVVQVLEGEFGFRAAEQRYSLSSGGMLVLEGGVPYEVEALTDGAFLHTVVAPSGQEGPAFPQPVHPTEPAEGRPDLDLPGAERSSEE